MNPIPQSLEGLYSLGAGHPQAWLDAGDHAYICTYLIELSIAALAGQLVGDLLDVGCGRQPYNPYFKHVSKKINCDHDGTRGEVDFTCSACDIPVPEHSFDSILCTEVLEHVPEPIAVWREFFRILRPGGKVLLTTPMYWPAHELPYDFYRYPEHGLRYLAESTGFVVDALIPRGGIYAFLGQTILMGLQQYFPFRLQRSIWNKVSLCIDKARHNPRMTLGWTILATKPGTNRLVINGAN